MFPLHTPRLPIEAAELESLLNQSLAQVFTSAGKAVTVRDRAFPELAEIRIALDGAALRPDLPPPPRIKGSSSPALRADRLEISGSHLTLGPTVVDLRLTARGVQLHQAQDDAGEVVLVLQSAAHGEVEITAAKEEIERAIAAVAQREAGKQGVTISDVRLAVTERGPRSVSADVQLHGRKLFFSTTIRITAHLDLDEQLKATLSGLKCAGDGAIAAVACGVLDPHLQKLDGRTFALMALPLGEIRLRDVRLAARDKLAVTAEFGAG